MKRIIDYGSRRARERVWFETLVWCGIALGILVIAAMIANRVAR